MQGIDHFGEKSSSTSTIAPLCTPIAIDVLAVSIQGRRYTLHNVSWLGWHSVLATSAVFTHVPWRSKKWQVGKYIFTISVHCFPLVHHVCLFLPLHWKVTLWCTRAFQIPLKCIMDIKEGTETTFQRNLDIGDQPVKPAEPHETDCDGFMGPLMLLRYLLRQISRFGSECQPSKRPTLAFVWRTLSNCEENEIVTFNVEM